MNSSELILNSDGSIYHLGLLPGEVAETIITVGDQDRVAKVSKYFDRIEYTRKRREFVTHTGYFRGKRLTVISTGIGTDNVDIVINELHALFNLDLETGAPQVQKKPLDFIRIGTSGAVQPHIPVGEILLSTMAVGFDGLMHFYDHPPQLTLEKAFYAAVPAAQTLPKPYFSKASEALLKAFMPLSFMQGVTLTAPGFYAPQGRNVNLHAKVPDLIKKIEGAEIERMPVTNIEMETAGIYGLAEALGHRAVSLSALLANRATGAFAENPEEVIDELIVQVLNQVTEALPRET